MLNRIVSLALIVCFLPLPCANSVGAWEFMNFASEASVSETGGADDCSSPDQAHGRILELPLTFDPQILVFCEVENEVRENETKDGEDDLVGLSVSGSCSSRNRFESHSLRFGTADHFRNLDNFSSRYHILRC